MKKTDIESLTIQLDHFDTSKDSKEFLEAIMQRLEKIAATWENEESLESLYLKELAKESSSDTTVTSTSTGGGATANTSSAQKSFVGSTTPSGIEVGEGSTSFSLVKLAKSSVDLITDEVKKSEFNNSSNENATDKDTDQISASSINIIESNSSVYSDIESQQVISVPVVDDVNSPSNERIKSKIKKKIKIVKATKDKRAIKYWEDLLDKFENGATANDFNKKEGHEEFTKMYFDLQGWRLATDEELKNRGEIYNLNWSELSEKIIFKIINLLNEEKGEEVKEYYKKLIQEIKKAKNIKVLFEEHDELFVLLKSIFPKLPNSINVYTLKSIYPNLSPKKIYPIDIGAESIYFIWAKTLLNEVVVKGGIGERTKKSDGTYPKLKKGQWYDYDRINNPTKKDSSFWKAAIYNTEKGNHFYYNTIAQRHAYYLFADAYLKEKKIISQWFEAAAIVTIGSLKEQMNGETALGAAEGMNLWYLSKDTEDFLKGGNRYLFQDNMENVRLLLKGKGRLSGQFTDAKGKLQTFKNLTKQELDLKLVEFEQSLVQEYINQNLDEKETDLLDITSYSVKKAKNLIDFSLSDSKIGYEDLVLYYSKEMATMMSKSKNDNNFDREFLDVIASSDQTRKKAIIKQINENFTHWMSPDIMQDVLNKYFRKGEVIDFNFGKYDDRVKLGQSMVKELYFLAKSDVFKSKIFDTIINKPNSYFKKSESFIIDQKDTISIDENEKHLKDYKFFERIERINNNLSIKVPYILENSNEIVETFVNLVLSAVEELVDALIDIAENIIQELEKLYNELKSDLIEAILKDNKNKYTLQNYLEILRKILEKIYASHEKIKASTINRFKAIPLNTMGLLMEKTAKQIYPPFNPNWKEEKKIDYFKSNDVATVAILLYEFGSSKGPAIRNFDYYEHAIAKAIIKDRIIQEIMEETLILLRKTNYDFEKMPDSKEFKINLEFSPTPIYTIESLDKHLASDLAQIFIGGAFALVRIRNKKIEGYIYNETSLESLLLHLDIGNVERTGKNDPRLSTIIQRYYFTFKLPKKQ
ncbi:hypothetical protein V3468_03300 [Flavobacterium oreochromis]|uniref:hypothetical protein n=1 Tax=Flavobacterium oreochromis TaxID=2906078 RepID=UPI00385BD85F